MEKWKLVHEYKNVKECLVEKTQFIYSEDFYKLDECEKQKYMKDKMATEAHLSTLCELLWGKRTQLDNGLGSMFALGILSSMFGGGFGSSSTSMDYLKETLEENGSENKEKVYAIPSNGNKAE